MKDTQKRPFWKYLIFPFVALVSAVILIWAILQGYLASWTGFADYTTPTGEFVRGKTLWDWLELLIIPLLLGIGALAFNRSEREAERRGIEARSQLERELTTENQREAALQSYLDRMAELLLNKQLDEPGNYAVQDVARIRTLAVLRALDPKRKGLVLIFLHEAGLIRRQPDERIINLSDADLSEADLTGALLKAANLEEANLVQANLFQTDLRGANLMNANLSEAVLMDANLTGANLRGTNLTGANLVIAYLERADLTGADLLDADLSQANLKGADLTDTSLSDESITITRRVVVRMMKDHRSKDIWTNKYAPKPVLRQARLMNAIYDRATVWPEGFDPKAAGAIQKDE